jgi:hypothetical protein
MISLQAELNNTKGRNKRCGTTSAGVNERLGWTERATLKTF